MPFRVNGVGTGYYGKKNREEYHGMCEYCGRPGTMQNYETRLWFSFLFIPVIPLTRKQILDYCSYCTRHKALGVAEWERIQSEAIQQSSDQLAENQDDPDAAVNMHLTLTAFHKTHEADRLAGIMREKFGDNAQVQLYLAGWYEGQGKLEEMRACLDLAQRLDPDNPAVRRAMGMTLIEEGRLEKARETLAVLEPPSEHYEPAVFYTLGKGYQQAQEHAQALEVFQMILETTPQAAEEKEFRNSVRESEKTLGRQDSILPPKPAVSGKALAWLAVVLLIGVGVLFWNYYISTHRTLYVVNGLAAPITVQIMDAGEQLVETVDVAPQTGWAVTIPEGTYRAQLAAPEAVLSRVEPVNFTISSGWWDRFFENPAYVIDPSQSALVMWQAVTYRFNPRLQDFGSDPFTAHIGKPFTSYADVDYVFEEFPEEVTVSEGKRETQKTGINLEPSVAALLPLQYPEQQTPEEWLNFVERHLSVSPSDQLLLGTYRALAVQYKQVSRGLDFLKSHLSDRPVNVDWHRTYQHLAQLAGQTDEVRSEYEHYLAKEPDNSSLLYLRARLSSRASESLEYLDQALKADGDNAWALMSKSFTLMAQRKFAEAKTVIERAYELDPDNHMVHELYWDAHFAVKDFEPLEKRLDSPTPQQAQLGLNAGRSLRLTRAQGDREELQKSLDKMSSDLSAGLPPEFMHAINSRQVQMHDLLGEFDKAADLAETLPADQNYAATRFHAFAADGRLEKAAQVDLQFLDDSRWGFYQLSLALAYQLQGDAKSAQQWKQKGIETLHALGESERYIAEVLKKAGDDFPTDEEVADLLAEPRWKAMVLCLLAEHAEEDRQQQLLDSARELNFELEFPYQLIDKATGR